MTTFPGSPRILKGGIVLIDPVTTQVVRVIVLQYNADTLTRTLQVQAVAAEGADRSEALRIKAPPVETIKLDAEIDATDQLELPESNKNAVEFGIQPQLAILETLLYPTSAQLFANDALAKAGTLEITPMESPLTLLVWSKIRVLPVRLTDFSVTEEAFDVSLNPIRAKVSLGFRVLNVNDVGFAHKAGTLFMSYLTQKERLAASVPGGALAALGLLSVP
jgi:hypothetical protein